jgi:hypothetical protein
MDRRHFLIASTGLAAVTSTEKPALAAHSTDHTSRQARPNVLLIIADDQGLDAGCYGGRVKTLRQVPIIAIH